MEFKIELRIERDAERQGEFKIVRENEYGDSYIIDWFEIDFKKTEVTRYLCSSWESLLNIDGDTLNDFNEYVELLKRFNVDIFKNSKPHWKPEDGTDFYWLDTSGNVQVNNFCNDYASRRGNYNAFPSYELAEMAINTSKLGRLTLLWQYNNDCLYTPDVKDKKNRYTIKFSSILNKLICVEVSYTQGDSVYFETEEQCKAFIEMYKDEVKALWGIGDEQ